MRGVEGGEGRGRGEERSGVGVEGNDFFFHYGVKANQKLKTNKHDDQSIRKKK